LGGENLFGNLESLSGVTDGFDTLEQEEFCKISSQGSRMPSLSRVCGVSASFLMAPLSPAAVAAL
jgi:hypothetical protein